MRFLSGFVFCTIAYLALIVPTFALITENPHTPPAIEIQKPKLSYSLGALVKVSATENAASQMFVGLWAPLHVYPDGSVRGEGVVRYENIDACKWQPPHPDNGAAPYCRIDHLSDGRFTISGSVVTRVHRHDDENDIKDIVFSYADERSSTRLGYVPTKLKLKFSMIKKPSEQLSLWGFSKDNLEKRTTGAAELGLLVSNLFDKEFEIAPIPTDGKITHGVDLQHSNQYFFEGNYSGGTPVSGHGSVFFSRFKASNLPKKTDPRIYYVHEDKSPKPRVFTLEEKKAIEDYKKHGYQQASHFYEMELAEQLNSVMAGLTVFNFSD